MIIDIEDPSTAHTQGGNVTEIWSRFEGISAEHNLAIWMKKYPIVAWDLRRSRKAQRFDTLLTSFPEYNSRWALTCHVYFNLEPRNSAIYPWSQSADRKGTCLVSIDTRWVRSRRAPNPKAWEMDPNSIWRGNGERVLPFTNKVKGGERTEVKLWRTPLPKIHIALKKCRTITSKKTQGE